MKAGNLKIFSILFFFLFLNSTLISQEKLNLNNIEPTFEEDTDFSNIDDVSGDSKLKSKVKKKSIEGNTMVNLKALDKITAKTSLINIPVGKKKKFGYLEIFQKMCFI